MAQNKLDVGKLERLLNRNLTEEESYDVALWEKGRALAHQVILPGWDVILEMLRSYAEDSKDKLSHIDPSKKDEILAEHSVCFAAQKIYSNFVEDVQRAVNQPPPSVIREQLQVATNAPPEGL
jgi:hypothetical protein